MILNLTREQQIDKLERMYAEAEASERLYRLMQAGVLEHQAERQRSTQERAEFERAAIRYRIESRYGWLAGVAWSAADWVLRRFGA